jgi:hypothetical protein
VNFALEICILWFTDGGLVTDIINGFSENSILPLFFKIDER